MIFIVGVAEDRRARPARGLRAHYRCAVPGSAPLFTAGTLRGPLVWVRGSRPQPRRGASQDPQCLPAISTQPCFWVLLIRVAWSSRHYNRARPARL
eukprot:7879565-Alexandrium_andersonii.AAC.2